MILILCLVIIAVVILNVPSLRQSLITRHLLPWFQRALPAMSPAERAAVESGTPGFEAQLFSGSPNYQALSAIAASPLSAEEQVFLSGPVDALCAMLDPWWIQQHKDLPPRAWEFIKSERFLGLIIPKQYGGRGFSNAAHAAVVTRLATRSDAAAVTVMVPNSLGPAELLLHYGTEEQKNYYLPRLASGQEIPCFALTNPWAGSDAGSIPDTGKVVREMFNGSETLGFRVTWSKRYITLGPVATVLGLAFRAIDPDHLLSDNESPGITCALVPTNHEGVSIGRRHAPLEASFMNGPNWGTDVFIPMQWVIGGSAQVGHGWAMLMECLAAGRGISLPSMGIASQMFTVRTVGAYAALREQFGLPIARFHGVAMLLGKMAARLYAQDGARRITYSELDSGGKPAVASAILKYHLTEAGRDAVNAGMDILGGKGISNGPRNFLAHLYQSTPIAITVEGANILTRNLIIFGQGAFRCHPFVQREMAAAADQDVPAFDQVLFEHLRHVAGNIVRSLGLFPSKLPPHDPRLTGPWSDINQLSARFALTADFALLILGGQLKRLELQSARLGDVLAHLYMACGALTRWDLEGRRDGDLVIARVAAQNELHAGYRALADFYANAPLSLRLLGWLATPTGIKIKAPFDDAWIDVAGDVTQLSGLRERLTQSVYVPQSTGVNEPVAQLERALHYQVELHATDETIRADRIRSGLSSHDGAIGSGGSRAVPPGLALTPALAFAWSERERLVADLVNVDDFGADDFPRVARDDAAATSSPATSAVLTARAAQSDPAATPEALALPF